MEAEEQIDHIIIPPAEAQEFVAETTKVYLRDCVCRVREQACPPDAWEVCLLFEHASEDWLQEARLIPIDKALAILRASEEQGLVNHIFYTRAGQDVTEICNCCTCCCRPLREMKEEGNYKEYLRSGFVAITDVALCVGCGLCLDGCFFEARYLEDGEMRLVDERCFGCGRCVGHCPEGAIGVESQPGRGVPIPGG